MSKDAQGERETLERNQQTRYHYAHRGNATVGPREAKHEGVKKFDTPCVKRILLSVRLAKVMFQTFSYECKSMYRGKDGGVGDIENEHAFDSPLFRC